jgi:hypothetical protein
METTMDRRLAVLGLVLVAGCSSSSSTPSPGDDAGDGEAADGSSSLPETGTDAPTDSTTGTGGDSGGDSGGGGDASDAATCPSSWTALPTMPTAIQLPDGGVVLLHAAGAGTQNYTCVAVPPPADAGDDADTFNWSLTGPTATLSDCNATVIGHHFASDGGAAFPEWQLNDGTYVVGTKVPPTFTPDGGGGSVPWLLLKVVDAGGGTGPLTGATFVQRLDTDGGVAPSTGCDLSSVGNMTTVPYTADYYFYGP